MADTVGSCFSPVLSEGNSEKIFTFILIFLGTDFVGEDVEINWLEAKKHPPTPIFPKMFSISRPCYVTIILCAFSYQPAYHQSGI